MAYGCETLKMGIEVMQRLEGAEIMLEEWICEVTLKNDKTSVKMTVEKSFGYRQGCLKDYRSLCKQIICGT